MQSLRSFIYSGQRSNAPEVARALVEDLNGLASCPRRREPDDDGIIAEKSCFRRIDGHEPDRGAERDALLSTIRAELASCARGLTHEVMISIELKLDESGAATKVDTRSDPTGEPVAACVERAVVGAASFAPGSEGSSVPVNVTLPMR